MDNIEISPWDNERGEIEILAWGKTHETTVTKQNCLGKSGGFGPKRIRRVVSDKKIMQKQQLVLKNRQQYELPEIHQTVKSFASLRAFPRRNHVDHTKVVCERNKVIRHTGNGAIGVNEIRKAIERYFVGRNHCFYSGIPKDRICK